MFKKASFWSVMVVGAMGMIAALPVQKAHAEPAREFSIAGQQFTEAEIIDARALPALDGGAVIMVTFSDAAATRISNITRAELKKPLAIRLDGKILTQPVISEPILDGVINISGSFAFKEAQTIAKTISGKDPLPDSLAEDE